MNNAKTIQFVPREKKCPKIELLEFTSRENYISTLDELFEMYFTTEVSNDTTAEHRAEVYHRVSQLVKFLEQLE